MPRNPWEFNRIANTIFSPVYPVIARRMLEWSGGSIRGVCLDIGTGPGLLARALAGERDLHVIAMDSDARMLPIARENARQSDYISKIDFFCGDVHFMPVRTGSIALVASRGSFYFWQDRIRAFSEIERVLRPGGVAYVGGGFGDLSLKSRVFSAMREINPDWDVDVARRQALAPPDMLEDELQKSGIAEYLIREDEAGLWVVISKP